MSSLQILDFIATFVFALVGSRVAASKNMDYGGIAFVAAVTALSGGTFRNLALNLKPGWLVEPYLLIAVVMAVSITIIFKAKDAAKRFVLILDSISLAVAVVAAVDLSMDKNVGVVGTVVLGVLSAVLGGLVRDVLCQIPPILLHRETIGTSSLLGAIACVALYQTDLPSAVRAIVSGLVVVAVRLVSVKYKWNLPKIK
ncbi:MAG: trimeric intracellular cation channel family protein [Candidatus Nanopelagicaceae bacterium]|jgi:uncharacterized membrane protein YeiH